MRRWIHDVFGIHFWNEPKPYSKFNEIQACKFCDQVRYVDADY